MRRPPARHFESLTRCGLWRRTVLCLMISALLVPDMPVLAATERHGQVTFGGLPVPGATVTATMGDKDFTAITDAQGAYSFAGLDDGMWTFKVEMRGFATQTQEIALAADTPPTMWELKLLPLEEITRGIAITTQPDTSSSTGAPTAPTSPRGTGAASATPPAKSAQKQQG